VKPDGKNILMVNPGFREFGEFRESGNHPFGMLRAAAWLKAEHGCDITFVDGSLEPEMNFAFARLKERHPGVPVKKMQCGNYDEEHVSKWQNYYGRPLTAIRNAMAAAPSPDEVWVGSGMTYQWETTAEIVEIAQQMFPSVRVRVGGIYPSLCREHAIRNCPGADVWSGEIPEASGYWPDYDILGMALPFRTIKWNTGCTVAVQCSFCAVKTLEPKFKVRDSESLEQYLEREVAKGVRTLRIWASQLLQPPQAFADLMDRLYLFQAKHGIRLRLYASEGVQPSLFTPMMARRMVEAGFDSITIPMEAIDPETLKRYNKPSGVSDYLRAVEISKEAGFSNVGIFIMIGTPQQTIDEVVHAVVDCWYRRVTPILMKHTIIPGSQDWNDFRWVHEGKDLHELHPSLWASARPELRVLELEEVVAIARMGYELWRALPKSDQPYMKDPHHRTGSRVDEAFVRWCSRYGLVKKGRFVPLEFASPHEPPYGRRPMTREDQLHSFGGHDSVTMVA
jgi:uncharacterized radical SAM superfamily protein